MAKADKNYVVRIYFTNGTHEPLKYENEKDALDAYREVGENVLKEDRKIGEITMSDGTKFAFKIASVSHWKFFKYTESAYEKAR